MREHHFGYRWIPFAMVMNLSGNIIYKNTSTEKSLYEQFKSGYGTRIKDIPYDNKWRLLRKINQEGFSKDFCKYMLAQASRFTNIEPIEGERVRLVLTNAQYNFLINELSKLDNPKSEILQNLELFEEDITTEVSLRNIK